MEVSLIFYVVPGMKKLLGALFSFEDFLTFLRLVSNHKSSYGLHKAPEKVAT
jgi:hypothetical protein